MPRQAPRQEHPHPGKYGIMVNSFALSLRADGKAEKTINIYTGAARWLGGWLLEHHPKLRGWEQIGRDHLREFFVHLRETGYSKGYSNQVGRSLQAFFRWFSEEERVANPFSDNLRPPAPPKLDENLVPVLLMEQLATLIKDAERGNDFESRRDAALLRLFACTGARLSEVALMEPTDINLDAREAVVTGKGGKRRVVKFDARAARALDRYLRERAKRPAADLDALWLGVKRRDMGMTPSGVRQVIRRRGKSAGIDVHPHMFRHTFVDRWLDNGGAEGDLMELAGWESPQMLRRYGRSARSARARRAYDRIDVMGGV